MQTNAQRSRSGRQGTSFGWRWLAVWLLLPLAAWPQDLPEIRKAGVLRHLGVPYAHFVTGSGDGLDVDLVKAFAGKLGLRYEYVRTDWSTWIADLSGRSSQAAGEARGPAGAQPIRGDLAASGITVLPWREELVDFSDPAFPTQVWLVARADSVLRPIRPTGTLAMDIAAVKRLLAGRSLLCKADTCLAPELYDIAATRAAYRLFPGSLNEIAPAILNNEAELTLLDVPDTLVALQKWPGTLKIIGPISGAQDMGVAFRKDSPELRAEFNRFLAQARQDGTYRRFVEKYYPLALDHFPGFFAVRGTNQAARVGSVRQGQKSPPVRDQDKARE